MADTDQWMRSWRWRRLKVGLVVYRHRYSVRPDRWVFQPSLVFDRRRNS